MITHTLTIDGREISLLEMIFENICADDVEFYWKELRNSLHLCRAD